MLVVTFDTVSSSNRTPSPADLKLLVTRTFRNYFRLAVFLHISNEILPLENTLLLANIRLLQQFGMTFAQVLGTGVLLSFILTVVEATRRLYFHPLSHIPGPRLAALTWWYEFYFDVVQPGQYVFQIQELHKQYGKIVFFILCK